MCHMTSFIQTLLMIQSELITWYFLMEKMQLKLTKNEVIKIKKKK